MLFKLLFAVVVAKALSSPVGTTNLDPGVSNYLSVKNNYGAPNPPWVAGAHPGWYYGNDHPPTSYLSLRGVLIPSLPPLSLA